MGIMFKRGKLCLYKLKAELHWVNENNSLTCK